MSHWRITRFSMNHRNTGLGPLLLHRVEAWAKANGYTILRVPCNDVRADAHRCYAREGFREIKLQRIFERDLRGSST